MLALVSGAVIALESQTTRLGDNAVVVELFTSQGCSSCPPADALLRRIAHDPKLRGKVVPLAYHVDYWNHLGWRDPYSSREWSQRQGDYVRAMKVGSAYTPQIVVNGTRQMVGSNAFGVYVAIEEESWRKQQGDVRVILQGGDAIVHASTSRPNLELVVVTFADAADTRVVAGENGGKTLMNDVVARSLSRVDAQPGKAIETRVALNGASGAAAFLQEKGTRRIVAAARVAPSIALRARS